VTLAGWAVIHRDELSLSALTLDGTVYSNVSYKIDQDGIILATAAYDIDEVSSPFVEGSLVTNDIRGMVAQQIKVQCRCSTNQSDLQAGVGVLLAAVQQSSFQFDLVIGGATWSWLCRRKTYGVTFDAAAVFSKIVVVPVEFDRFPTPLAGPY